MSRAAFHRELRDIESAVLQMGTSVEADVGRALRVALEHDTILALAAHHGSLVMEQRRHIRSWCLEVMACQAPVAGDLSKLLDIQLIITEFGQIDTCAADIVRQTRFLSEYLRTSGSDLTASSIVESGPRAQGSLQPPSAELVGMGEYSQELCSLAMQVQSTLRSVLEVMASGDVAKAETSRLEAVSINRACRDLEDGLLSTLLAPDTRGCARLAR